MTYIMMRMKNGRKILFIRRDKMKEYYLFLDESKPNTNFQNFTLGGIAIEKDLYEKKFKPFVIAL